MAPRPAPLNLQLVMRVFVFETSLLCVLRCPFRVGILAIEVGDKFGGVFQVLHRFPGAVTCGETLPLDQVMEFASLSLSAYLLYFFNFIFFFSIDKVQCWSGIVQPV